MKIALVHDWLNGMRGGEKVLLEICRLFPQADIFTLSHIPGNMHPDIERHRIFSSVIDKFPGGRTYYRKFLPVMPILLENFDFTGYDLVISTSHCVAKGAIPRPDAVHISYIHSPMRYIWDLHFAYFPKHQGNVLARMTYRAVASYLRAWDVASSTRVDHFIANSTYVQKRINKYYRRQAEVIHPPVEVDQFRVSDAIDDYYVLFSSFVPYKRHDLAIEAFNRLGAKLKVIGSGPGKKKLQRLAHKNIEFLGWVDNDALKTILSRARALVFPALEDFGMIPVEANASGLPVIAFGAGGVLDSLVPLQPEHNGAVQPTGLFFHEQSVPAIVQAVQRFERHERHFQDRQAIRQATFRFQPSLFRKRFLEFVLNVTKQDDIALAERLPQAVAPGMLEEMAVHRADEVL